MSSAIILHIVYGYRILSAKDSVLELAERFIAFLRGCVNPCLLDVSPICAYHLLHPHTTLILDLQS